MLFVLSKSEIPTIYERPQAARLSARLAEPRRHLQVVAEPRQVGKTTLTLADARGGKRAYSPATARIRSTPKLAPRVTYWRAYFAASALRPTRSSSSTRL